MVCGDGDGLVCGVGKAHGGYPGAATCVEVVRRREASLRGTPPTAYSRCARRGRRRRRSRSRLTCSSRGGGGQCTRCSLLATRPGERAAAATAVAATAAAAKAAVAAAAGAPAAARANAAAAERARVAAPEAKPEESRAARAPRVATWAHVCRVSQSGLRGYRPLESAVLRGAPATRQSGHVARGPLAAQIGTRGH